MSSAAREKLLGDSERVHYTPMLPVSSAKTTLLRQGSDITAAMNSPIFEELPKATILSVSRPDVSDITSLLLSYTYTIEVQYKQFRWLLQKKATQVLSLHISLKKRSIFEEFHEKQEQVKEWLHNLGILDHAAVMHNDDDFDDDVVRAHQDSSSLYQRPIS